MESRSRNIYLVVAERLYMCVVIHRSHDTPTGIQGLIVAHVIVWSHFPPTVFWLTTVPLKIIFRWLICLFTICTPPCTDNPLTWKMKIQACTGSSVKSEQIFWQAQMPLNEMRQAVCSFWHVILPHSTKREYAWKTLSGNIKLLFTVMLMILSFTVMCCKPE